MATYRGTVENWATGTSIALGSGGQVDLINPQGAKSKTNGDTEKLHIGLSGTVTPIATDTMVSVQGLLGAIATIVIKDKSNRTIKN